MSFGRFSSGRCRLVGLIGLAIGAVGLTASNSSLCRYTIRDLGFVPLGSGSFELLGPEEKSESLDSAELREAGVEWARADGSDPEWVLRGDGREDLPLGTGTEEAVRAVLESPLRSRLTQESLGTFAFVLRVEGEDAAENLAAQKEVDIARRGLELLAPQLPRPIDLPVVDLICRAEHRSEERVLLWSLGIPVDDGKSWFALLYGRGQRVGPPWIAGSDDGLELLSQLALVGQSCECETDRDWALEPRVPMAWGTEERAAAPASLGFDPESPWVRAEVVRILAKGGDGGLRGETPGEIPRGSLEELMLGFRIDALPEAAGSPGPVGVASYRDGPPGVKPFGLRRDTASPGDDWGFDEGPSVLSGSGNTVGEDSVTFDPSGTGGHPDPGLRPGVNPEEPSDTAPRGIPSGTLLWIAGLGGVSVALALLVLVARGRR